MEEKYKQNGARNDEDDDDSSEDETEDENGFLATEDLDAQISATLQAIRSKDPRVYDNETTFYNPDTADPQAGKKKKEKPVFLKDYHREKIMRGDVGESDDDEPAQQTYAEEQDALKKAFKSQVDAEGDGSDSDDDGFMLKKKQSGNDAATTSNGVHPSRKATITAAGLDIDGADKDPEHFLSNFMAARAWVDEEGSKWKAFESDDGEDDDKADEFEQAYNMRFEDPEKSNEVLRSYARDVTNSRSVRREEKSGRKRQRELEKERKEAEKQERKDEKGRLRKLKLEDAENKLRKIKQAAGKVGKDLDDSEWMAILDGAWENDKWEEEMQKRFGDDYYAVQDDAAADSDDDDAGAGGKKKSKPKKPKWDDDVDIKDLVPDFDEEEIKAKFALSDEEAGGDDAEEGEEEDDDDTPAKKKRKTADHKKARQESQKKARQERAQLEALIDSKMELTDHDLLLESSRLAKDAASAKTELQPFRYRETSPQSFGMTARDILLAPSDKDLNDYAGLKKLATFREQEKKQKDRKRLGKKARLRQWRRDVFGNEFERSGPTFGFEQYATEEDVEAAAAAAEHKKHGKRHTDKNANIIEGDASQKKKRKRSKGAKSEA